MCVHIYIYISIYSFTFTCGGLTLYVLAYNISYHSSQRKYIIHMKSIFNGVAKYISYFASVVTYIYVLRIGQSRRDKQE